MNTKVETAAIIVMISFLAFVFQMPGLAMILAGMACLVVLTT